MLTTYQYCNLLSINCDFLLRLLSVHHPFSADEIKKYSQILKWGNGFYTADPKKDISYEQVCIAMYGLCFNSNIKWTPELEIYSIDDPMQLELSSELFENKLYHHFPLVIEKEMEARTEVMRNVYLECMPKAEAPDVEVTQYYEKLENLTQNYAGVLGKEFNFSSILDLICFTCICKDFYALNFSLYSNFLNLLIENQMEVISILDSFIEQKSEIDLHYPL
ncbi:hypothetical protein NF867_09360 [Solitalea sp. MAHUQ-68]|uniref:Uncharacterized protein n=1 Tax=Solitalea agri TaxID=2953739 RepID=A0A9X2F2N1_9SPHI|nr:hypothetical protein [Solitalea agri]MCO4293070.1 hypothetical protein [Solitalea agri]